jgi:hypothetical protein
MLLGLAAGIATAAVLSAWVLVVGLLTGSRTLGRSAPLSIPAIIGAYFAALPAAGTLGGLLWPLGRSRLGAAAGGALCALMLYGSIEAAQGTLLPLRASHVAVYGILALAVGVPAGLGYRDMFGARGSPKRRRPGRDTPPPPAS